MRPSRESVGRDPAQRGPQQLEGKPTTVLGRKHLNQQQYHKSIRPSLSTFLQAIFPMGQHRPQPRRAPAKHFWSRGHAVCPQGTQDRGKQVG